MDPSPGNVKKPQPQSRKRRHPRDRRVGISILADGAGMERAEVREGEGGKADPSPPFARDATGFGMTTLKTKEQKRRRKAKAASLPTRRDRFRLALHGLRRDDNARESDGAGL
jgi:hypothetical protein